jgi:hypothetical protein
MMVGETNLLVTVKRVSAVRRFWRELWALIQWGLQHSTYYQHDTPFIAGILGHEGFSVFGRKNADEVELVFFEPMWGPSKNLRSTDELSKLRVEMRQAIAAIAKKHGYDGVYYRKRRPSNWV